MIDRGFDRPDQHARQPLAEQDVDRAQRRDQQLVEGAALALSRDREGDHHQRHDLGQQRHDARHEEPMRAEGRVVAGADVERRRRIRLAVRGGPGDRKVAQNGVGVALDQQRGVGVAAVEDRLHRRRPSGQQISGEARIDHQRQHDLARIDQRVDLLAAVQRGDQPKGRRAEKMRDEVAGRLARVLVVDRDRHAVEIVSRGVAEQYQHDDRRADQHRAALGVAQHRQQLLDDQSENLPPHGRQSNRLRASARAAPRKIAAIAISAAALGRITDQTSPARNVDCRMATK